eukprot:CAMPEP_0181236568 /NCGR_PEP_ID=MMETSP1096-20121128/38257_1 /TAXON_ID=156174 ORGANISM="Chrysochromulina ericina, Strain CCMP281" /NCGR_SAMPLE_ID=MMETSP1096 /ASSEMBLY_ACC=CAM_ASM_000453 /LENGTH=80 /DNA_ID=CAMNT_0023331781 /DNA_START=114 /DNA_END=356 /DNA_ORIENTATION=-
MEGLRQPALGLPRGGPPLRHDHISLIAPRPSCLEHGTRTNHPTHSEIGDGLETTLDHPLSVWDVRRQIPDERAPLHEDAE